MKKLGSKQFAWVTSHAFPNGAIALHVGPILLAIRLPERWAKEDPSEWTQREPATAPTLTRQAKIDNLVLWGMDPFKAAEYIDSRPSTDKKEG